MLWYVCVRTICVKKTNDSAWNANLLPAPITHHLQPGSITVTRVHHHVAHLYAHILAFVVSLLPVDATTTGATAGVASTCCLQVAGVLTASSATVASAPAGIVVSATTARASPASSSSPSSSSSWFLVGHLRVDRARDTAVALLIMQKARTFRMAPLSPRQLHSCWITRYEVKKPKYEIDQKIVISSFIVISIFLAEYGFKFSISNISKYIVTIILFYDWLGSYK